MTDAEKCIQKIEDDTDPSDGLQMRALCEIARQLARLADLREFELGIGHDAGAPRAAAAWSAQKSPSLSQSPSSSWMIWSTPSSGRRVNFSRLSIRIRQSYFPIFAHSALSSSMASLVTLQSSWLNV